MNINSDFLDSIIIEEDPFEGENPDEVVYYNLSGKEVKADEAE